MKMRKYMSGALVLALTAASVLSGCGKSSNTQVTEPVSGTEVTTESGAESTEAKKITMMCWYSEDTMQGVIDEINNQLNGEYVVEYTFIGNTDYNNVLSTQLAAGEGPDIIADGANFPARIKAGNVQDITGAGYTDGFSDEGLALCTLDGKNYGIPCYGWFAGVFFNQDLFNQCGITQMPATYDEFLAVCKTLKDNGIQPLSMGLADSDNGLHSLCGFMESNFYEATEEGKDFDTRFAKGEATMSGTMNPYVERWAEMITEGYITPEMVGISGEQALEAFESGDAAMFYTGPWYYDEFKNAGMNFGVMPFMGDSKENEYLIGGPAASWGINTNTKNQDGAEKVLKALSSVEVQQAFINGNPGSSTYKAGVDVGLPDEYAEVKDVLNEGRIACCWDRWSVNMPSQSLIDELNSQVQGLVAGDLTVDDFLKTLDSKADSIRYE